MKTTLTYKKAIEELESIVEDIESGDVSIDALVTKIKRANELNQFCQEKLKSVEEEVNRLLPKKGKA